MCNCGNNGCGGCGGVSLPAGPAGPNGLNAFTFTTASFVQPTLATAAIVVPVSGLGQYTGLWATVGQWIFIEGAGTFVVTARTPTSITIDVPNAAIAALNAAIAAFGSTVTAGKAVSPSGIQGATGATGAPGTNGTNASELIAYRIITPPIVVPVASGVYTDMLLNPVNIPANSWNATGDVIKLEFIAMGTAGTGPTASTYLNFSFRIIINGVAIETTNPLAMEGRINKNSMFMEIDLIGFMGSPFTVLSHKKSVNVAYGEYGFSTNFTANSQYRHIKPTGTATYDASIGLATASTSIDPTVSNTLKIDGAYFEVGGGGTNVRELVVPYLKVSLHKAP